MIVRPIKFLVGFGATVMILLALWHQYGHYYIATLVPLANSLIGMENLPLGLVYDGEHMAISYLDVEGQWRNGELKGHELVYLNMIAAIALIVALPGNSLKRRFVYCGCFAAFLWVTHALSLYVGAYSAIGTYLEKVSGGSALVHGMGTLPQQWEVFPTVRAKYAGRILGVWNAVGAPSVMLIPVILLHSWTSAERQAHIQKMKWTKRDATGTINPPRHQTKSRHAA